MQALPCRLHVGGRRASAGFPALNICWPRGFPPCGSCVSGRRAPSSPAALLFGPVAQGRAAPSDSTDAGVCRVLLLRRAQSPLSVAKPCIRLASANHPAPRGPERPALGCGDVGMMSARACPRRTVSAVGRRGRWVRELALGGFAALGGVGICKTMREKLQKRRETEAKRMEICKINSCKFHLAIV